MAVLKKEAWHELGTELILLITTLKPSTMLLLSMLANVDALPKIGQEKSTHLVGLTSQITKKEQSLLDAPTETLRIFFLNATSMHFLLNFNFLK